MKPASRPGFKSGSTTRRNVMLQEAPLIAADSSSSLWIWSMEAELRIVKHRAIGIETDSAERIPRGSTVELLQRRPHQHQKRQQHDDHKINDEDCRREVAPIAEIDGARPEAFAGHGRIARALAG